MKICLFGKNLTNLILSQVLIKKGISVHMYYQKKNKLAKINYNRTIGLSFENIKFLKKYDIDIEKIGQKISKIFLYKNDSKETFNIEVDLVSTSDDSIDPYQKITEPLDSKNFLGNSDNVKS